MGGDEQVISANRLAFLFETGAENAVDPVGGVFEGQNLERSEHRLKLCRKGGRSFLRRTVPEFGGDDDAGRHLRLTYLSDPLSHTSLRVSAHR